MLAIELPDEVEQRLDALAKSTGSAAAAYARDVLLEHFNDLDDLRIAEERLLALKAGRSTTIPLADVMRKHGLVD